MASGSAWIARPLAVKNDMVVCQEGVCVERAGPLSWVASEGLKAEVWWQ